MKTRKFPNLRASSIVPLAVLLFLKPVHAARPAEEFADFTDDGGWCWFADPRAVSRDGKTFTGWITEDGSVEVASLDHASRRVSAFTLHGQYERDDHDNPSLLFLPDGRLRAFYTRHSEVEEINTRVTKRPGDITEWDPETTIVPMDDSPKNNGITYSNPFMLSAENNAIYLLWRGKSFKPTMAKSADGGRTWSPASPVFSMHGLPAGNRPYAKYASNGRDRIHMLFTDGHPRNEEANSVYYVCYRAGSFHKADGTRICGVDELPIRPEQADKVYDATRSRARAWIWEIAFDDKERPVVVYTRHPSEEDHRYHYARWTGNEWFDTELCAAGKWFPQTPAGANEREPHYTSGLALDPADPSILYLTRPVGGVRELEKWITADGGKSWESEAITAGSKHDNIRPYVVRDHAPGGPTVLWQNLSGRYVHYTDYRCSIKMDLPAAAGPSVPHVNAPKAMLAVSVTNPTDVRRASETVEVDLGAPGMAVVVMASPESRILDSQVIGNRLLFQVDLGPGETRGFQVLPADQVAVVPPAEAKTFCRFVPERMDDFAWESDRIAHRMYGPALITGEGTVSSGVDVWVKRTRKLVLDRWYQSDDYHADHGEGLDGYSVSHGSVPTRGCGGLGIWDGTNLYVSSNFKTHRVIANGPIRSEFELTYDTWDAGGRKVSEIKHLSIDAGSNFTRVVSTFTADGDAPLTLGIGIANRGGNDVASDLKQGWIAYWEPEQGRNGRTGCALVIPAGLKEFTKDEANLLAVAETATGKAFTYYLGAGWSKSGDFPDANAWESAVRDFALRLNSPLVVVVK